MAFSMLKPVAQPWFGAGLNAKVETHTDSSVGLIKRGLWFQDKFSLKWLLNEKCFTFDSCEFWSNGSSLTFIIDHTILSSSKRLQFLFFSFKCQVRPSLTRIYTSPKIFCEDTTPCTAAFIIPEFPNVEPILTWKTPLLLNELVIWKANEQKKHLHFQRWSESPLTYAILHVCTNMYSERPKPDLV